MGQERDEQSALGDEFDEIRARVDDIRRAAQQRIEALRDPTGLDVRLPPRPGSRPSPSAGPTRAATGAEPAGPERPSPGTKDRPAPPTAGPAPAQAGASPSRTSPPRPTSPPPPVPTDDPAPGPPVESRLIESRPVPMPVPPTPAPPGPERVPEPEPSGAAGPGRTIPVSDLPPAGDGWDAPLPDVADESVEVGVRPSRVAPLAAVRGAIEGIATSRSVLIPVWQVVSVLVLVAALVWVVWFPLVGGGGSQALVAADDRMAPTVGRGDVVVITPSVDLPYPLDAVVAIDAGGVVILERVVEEVVEDGDRLLVTRADGVSVGPSRQVRPEQVVGAVRRIHPALGYPALWFDDPDAVPWRIGLVLLLISSAVGAASLVVRAELRRQDRLLVSAIASGDRTPLRR